MQQMNDPRPDEAAGLFSAGITGRNGLLSAALSPFGSSTASVVAGIEDGCCAGHRFVWFEDSKDNQFSMDLSTRLHTEIGICFNIRSSLTRFNSLTYDTGSGPLPVPDANLFFDQEGLCNEWAINLSALDAVNSRSFVKLTWSFNDLGAGETVELDKLEVSGTPRPESRLLRNLEAGRAQTVVALGSSLTDKGAWVKMLNDVLASHFPGLVTVLNSGASGKNSAFGVKNLNNLVIQKKPDTLMIEYGINDSVERFNLSVEDAEANLTTIVDTTLAAFPDCEIILMTMTPGNKYEPGHTSYRKEIQDYYTMYRRFARERGFLLMDHFSSWSALQANDGDRFKKYVPDTIHPGAVGDEAVVFPALIDVLGIYDDGEPEN